MSFMPDEGVRVRLRDGRSAIVIKITPDGRDDRVRFDDGSEQRVTAWDISEVLSIRVHGRIP
jgi:hypothetical protein